MSTLRFAKVVASLPATLEPNTMYLVRVGAGFDLYVSDVTGAVAHKINSESTDNVSASTYTYDSEGRVSSISETLPSGTRTTTYTYDAQGRVTQAVQTLGSVTKTTAYAYDANGVLTGFTVTES